MPILVNHNIKDINKIKCKCLNNKIKCICHNKIKCLWHKINQQICNKINRIINPNNSLGKIK